MNQSQCYVTTDGQPASLSWNKASIWGLWPDEFTNELSFTTRGEPKRDHHNQQFVYWFVLSVATGMCSPNRCGVNVYEFRGNVLTSTSVFVVTKSADSEPLPSNGRPFRFSVAMSQYENHNTMDLFQTDGQEYKVHTLYEHGYVITCVCNLTEEKSRVCSNFPLAY
jgi:hypothetical protein